MTAKEIRVVRDGTVVYGATVGFGARHSIPQETFAKEGTYRIEMRAEDGAWAEIDYPWDRADG